MDCLHKNNHYNFYNDFRIVYLVITSIIFLGSGFIYWTKKEHNHNQNYKIKNDQNLNIICMSFCMLLYSIDPDGFFDIYPNIIVILLSDLTTCFGISIIILYLHVLIRASIINYNTLSYRHLNIIHRLLYIIAIIFSFLQEYVNYNIFSNIKLILFGTLIAYLSIFFNKMMLRTLQYMKDNTIHINSVNRIKKYVIIYDILIFTIIIFQYVSGIIGLKNNNNIYCNHLESILFFTFKILTIILYYCFTIKCKKNRTRIPVIRI